MSRPTVGILAIQGDVDAHRKALERRSTLPFAWLRMGMAHANLGQTETSRRDMIRALDLCDENLRLQKKIERASQGSFFNKILRFFRFPARRRDDASPSTDMDDSI